MKLSVEAVELLNSLERYAILKAIDEGKQLIAKIMTDLKSKGKDVEKVDMQNAIQKALEEIEQNRFNRKPS